MTAESGRTYRLVEQGGAGLTCDTRGVALGGVQLARAVAEGATRWEVRARDELGDILALAYGPQSASTVDRCYRGLQRIAARFETGDVALAGIEALMLRLPPIASDRMTKLAATRFRKGGDAWKDEPRLPAGQTGGGQWTSGGAAGGRRNSGNGAASDDKGSRRTKSPNEDSRETTVTSAVRQSRHENANGFFPNSAGGGVFYIPTTSGGRRVKPTEVHALDANAFRVSWNGDSDGSIRLEDRSGRTYEVGTRAAELERFNATTGRALGVNIIAFPETPLGAPENSPTVEEQRRLAEERSAFLAGRQASEDSWSGRVTTGAVLLTTALPFLALAPAAAEAAVETPLNAVENVWPESEEIGVGGGRPVTQARVYENGVRAQYPEGGMQNRIFSTVVNGERVSGVADGAAEIHGQDTAIESKYVGNWMRSLRNPAARAGKTNWGVREQARMVAQARKYSENFDGGVVYHTNSRELAAHYYRVFRSAGVTKFRFVITPAGK